MNSGAVALREAARAKINLFLHIAGRRPDGLHLIDSLVVFAEIGDVVTVRPGDGLSLTRTGPMAGALPPVAGDIVLRAASLLAETAGVAAGAEIELEKHLPVASGIGGGSADAAAAIRALARLWQIGLPPDRLSALAQELGADVPVCLESRPMRIGGIGEQLSPPGALAPLHAVLVNPRVAVSTAAVFAAFAAAAPSMSAEPQTNETWSRDPRELAQQLAACRNDLTAAAISLCPAIDDVLTGLGVLPECLLARMSGSGATCFGLFDNPSAAQAAASALQRDHPEWWVTASELGAGAGR